VCGNAWQRERACLWAFEGNEYQKLAEKRDFQGFSSLQVRLASRIIGLTEKRENIFTLFCFK
jgi:hypothetical protein